MVFKEEVRKFISKLNPFVQKIPEIADNVSRLENDDFQNLLGNRNYRRTL